MTSAKIDETIQLPHLLIIDDEKEVGEFTGIVAQSLGFAYTSTTNAGDFLAALDEDVTLILMDLMMPDMDGIELLRLLGQRKCKTTLILMSGYDKRVLETAEELAQTLGLSVAGHLQKPFKLPELQKLLKGYALLNVVAPVAKQASRAVTKEELQRAMVREELVLHYQPQLHIASGEVVGVEALVRWQHPERGLVFPDDFIPQAEALGVIDELGWYVARLGLSEIRQFVSREGTQLKLSLNVSSQSLHDLRLPDTFIALARQYGVAPENVVLEITESGLIKELASALDILTRLRMKRVHLSIDDFGTGYAMMQQLRHVPATELKIDKSFVQDMHQLNSARVVVRKTIEIGHELGMKIVAEGVETKEQLEFLHLNGCDIAQGYYFSRPVPAPILVDWIKHYVPHEF
ncbi:EAL domain-containing response regulator [Undibacterium sp.]|jgi:EAL domain-containing protein (putative c-di-GMP-specific phosphodiesterase class I)|uniref:EAL domain-containing response regulator n=1 Tax=Undibacterium sp. TaxID=1914977 RepID=UPI002BA9E902|nr:EAL domain-containing response regulator [Undibacterium sp.]HTD04362.1 EAL domain-containing response regulator [Undibacterium sp.]